MKLLLWPHAFLKKVCLPVEADDPDLRNQLKEMQELMLKAGGVGLAANQVGLTKRMLVAFQPGPGPQSFVNPRIVGYAGSWELYEEGCLSLPGIKITHRRNTDVIVESRDIDTGALFVQSYTGLLGHVLQHEIGHLDGKMMIDHLPGGQKDQLRQYMKKVRW